MELVGKEMELAIDVVYINRECFLHPVDRTIKEPSCVTLGTYTKGEAPTSEILYKALDKVMRKYNRANIGVGDPTAQPYFSRIHGTVVKFYVPSYPRKKMKNTSKWRMGTHKKPRKMIILNIHTRSGSS